MKIIALFTIITVITVPAVYASQECHTLDGVQYCTPDEQKDCINLNSQRLCKQDNASATAQNQQATAIPPQPVMDALSQCTQSQYGGFGYWTGTQYVCRFPQVQGPLLYGYGGISAYSSNGRASVGISIGWPYGGWYPRYGYPYGW